MTDKPLAKCRKCGGRLEKLLSAPAIQFKGSGWYVTDYAKAGKPEQTEGKSESKEEKSAVSETKGASDKATSPDKDSSKKASKAKPAPSSGD